MRLFSNVHKVLTFIIATTVLLLLSTTITAQVKLQSKLLAHAGYRDFKHANISVSVIDVEGGKLIAGINENKVLIPASSLKVITTLSSLNILGDDFTFDTKLAYSGKIASDGTLNGDIYIVGSGDPTLGSAKFKTTKSYVEVIKDMTQAIRRAGITCIEGDIIADESIYNSFPISPSWQWNDLGNYYASGAWGLNINENQYRVYLDKRGKVGYRPRVRAIDPRIPNLDLSNELVVDSVGTGDNAYIFGGPYNFYKRIVGTIPQGPGDFVIKGSIPDPPLFVAQLLQKSLKKRGIQSQDAKSTFENDRPKKTKDILKIQSPSLKEIVKRTNMESNNLYCESILKKLGAEKGTEGQAGIGIYILKKYLRKLGVATESLHMEDGSGLSARSNVSSLFLASFLQKFAKKNTLEYTVKMLPTGGGPGTLSGMFKKSPARGRVFAKSGSMSRVLSYTGFIKNKRGTWVSFSIIVNGFNKKHNVVRKKLEAMMTDIYKYS